jgi:hypothetical protein
MQHPYKKRGMAFLRNTSPNFEKYIRKEQGLCGAL